MKTLYIRAGLIFSVVFCAGFSDAVASGITVSTDRNDFMLVPVVFAPTFSGSITFTDQNIVSEDTNVTLDNANGIGAPAAGTHVYGPLPYALAGILEGDEYGLNGDENFDIKFSTPQTAFAVNYVDDSVDSIFHLNFFNGGTQVGFASFTSSAPFDTGKFVGFKSETSFDRVEFRENDGTANSNEFFQFYTVAPNDPPTAAAGADQAIRAGDLVNLNGSNSFDDNTASEELDYFWSFFSKPEASIAILSGAGTATPSFVADVAGNYVVELVVTDERGLSSDPDQVEISSNNLPPTAAAGDDHLVIIGTTLSLDGSASSDPESDALTFDWIISSAPAGNTAAIVSADAEIAFLTPDAEGVYELTLTVNDFIGAGTPDSCEVTVINAVGFAEFQILSANDEVAGCAPTQVTSSGNQNALQKHLSNAIKQLQKGKVDEAIKDLEKAIERTDGCMLRGAPDGNGKDRDWITDCGAQTEVHSRLNDALNALLAP